MKLRYISLIVISIFITTSCKKEKDKESVIYNGTKYYLHYASDYEDKEGNLDNIMSYYITDQHDTLLNDNQKFYKIPEQSIPEVHSIIENFLMELANRNRNELFQAKNFYRQYIGYIEKGHKYVYVNLLRFYLEGFEPDGCPLILTNYQSTPIKKTEYGYAGYIIINLDKKRIVKYHFNNKAV